MKATADTNQGNAGDAKCARGPRDVMPSAPSTRASILRRHAAALEEQARCQRELAALEERDLDGSANYYTSVSLPPDLRHLRNGRRAFAEWCRLKMPAGATLEGRVWSCPRIAWHESRRKPRVVLLERGAPESSDDALADRAMAGARMRRTA